MLKLFIFLILIFTIVSQSLQAAPIRRGDKLSLVQSTARAQLTCRGNTSRLMGSEIAGKVACFVGVNAVSLTGFLRSKKGNSNSLIAASRPILPIFTFSISF